MKPKVFINHSLPTEVRAYLDKYCDCRAWEEAESIPRRQLLEALAEVEGLLTVGGRIDGEVLDAAPRLRVVSNASVGYNNLDVEALRQRRVIATHTRGVLDETVADMVVGLMLACARRVPELDHHVKMGRWSKTDGATLYGVDVHHATLGVIGMGRIGLAVARRARLGFQMRVLYHNRKRQEAAEKELGCEYADLEMLLSESDFVVLMVPLTPQTKKMIGEAEFQHMKPSAIFLSCSRGQTVDESALIRALENNTIRAAGLDVYTQEPLPADSPFTRMHQVVTLPHIGSATARTRFAMVELAAKNLVAVLTGEKPPTPIPELEGLV